MFAYSAKQDGIVTSRNEKGIIVTYADGTTSTNILVNESHVSTLVSAIGCDSTLTENITVNPIYNLIETADICENSSITYPDGTTAVITASTSYTSNI